MSGHAKKQSNAGRVVLAILLLVSLATNVFLFTEKNKIRTERDQLAESNRTASDALNAFQTQLDGYKEETDALKEQLAVSEDALSDLEARLDEKVRTGLDPDAPAYTKSYPDFYGTPGFRATYAPDKTVYLTFDDGPSDNTEKLLEILDQYGVKATFFVVKKSGAKSAERLKAIADAGHAIGLHSASHAYKTIYASVDAYIKDQNDVFEWVKSVTGQKPSIFRFPGGSINSYNHSTYQEIIAEMVRRGFVPYDWNVSSGDANKNTEEMTIIHDNILAGCRSMGRSVVLMHDGNLKTTTVEALPDVIETLLAEGYTFEALTPNCKPTLFQYIDKVE